MPQMYRRKRPQENRVLFGGASLLALCGVVYMSFNIADAMGKYRESNRRLEASQSELANLNTQYEELRKERDHASSTTGIEQQIRSKFDLARPGESMVFITSEKQPEQVEEEKGIRKIFKSFRSFFN